jgi:hypothetical protein
MRRKNFILILAISAGFSANSFLNLETYGQLGGQAPKIQLWAMAILAPASPVGLPTYYISELSKID